jgi:hypothetical protein
MHRHVFTLAGALSCAPSLAVEHCISSTAELQALADQTSQGGGLQGDHHIKIVQGVYESDAPNFVAFGGELTIEGGYVPGCTSRTAGAQHTTLNDPSGTGRPSFHAFNGNLVVRDITLLGYGGLFAWPQGADSSALFQRVALVFSPAQFDGLQMIPTDGDALLENVLIDAGTVSNDECAFRGSSPSNISFQYVTIRNRGPGQGACLYSGGNLTVRNSIVLSDGLDFSPSQGALPLLLDTTAGELPVATAPGSDRNNTSTIPFEASEIVVLRNRPADSATQPVRDTATPIDGVTLDLLGHERNVNSAPDRGAMEIQALQDAVFLNGFE